MSVAADPPLSGRALANQKSDQYSTCTVHVRSTATGIISSACSTGPYKPSDAHCKTYPSIQASNLDVAACDMHTIATYSVPSVQTSEREWQKITEWDVIVVKEFLTFDGTATVGLGMLSKDGHASEELGSKRRFRDFESCASIRTG